VVSNQLAEFRASFVRVSTEDGIPVGAGFLVSEWNVLTCAHVIAEALRISGDTDEKPSGTVHLDFPFFGAAARIAHVEYWLPLRGPSKNPSGDIAVLELLTAPPDGAYPVHLSTVEDPFGRDFRAHGYPQGYDSGVWVYGKLRDHLSNGWLQAEDIKVPGKRIEQGFSGSPVEDQETGRIVGMVAASTRDRVEKVGFIIPTEILVDVYPQTTANEFSYRTWLSPRATVITPSNASEVTYLRVLGGHRKPVNSVAFSPDGQMLASGGGGIIRGDNTVRLWRTKDGAHLLALEGHKKAITSVAFSPDGQMLASAGADATVRLWAPDSGRLLTTLEGHTEVVHSVAFSPDGELLVSVGADAAVRFWRVKDRVHLETMDLGRSPSLAGSFGLTKRTITSVAFSADFEWFALGSEFGKIALMEWGGTKALEFGSAALNTPVMSLAFSPDGKLLASDAADKTARVWRVEDGALMRKMKHRMNTLRAVRRPIRPDPSGTFLYWSY
jgi:hypothetical protein